MRGHDRGEGRKLKVNAQFFVDTTFHLGPHFRVLDRIFFGDDNSGSGDNNK